VQPKQRKRNMRFGTWNVRSLYRAGSLTAAARELARYKLYIVGVQEVSWDKDSTVWAGDFNFSLWKRKRKSSFGNRNFVHQRIISAVKRVEFVSDRMSRIVLRGRWCNITVLNMPTPSEEKSNDSKDSFYEESEQGFFIFS